MGKKKEEPFNLNEVKKQVKQKEETEMKNIKNNSTIKTIATVTLSVLITLGVVYAGYTLYQMGKTEGINYQKSLSAQMESEVTARVEQLKS